MGIGFAQNTSRGKKGYVNNIPMIIPKTAKAMPAVHKQTTKVRNRTTGDKI